MQGAMPERPARQAARERALLESPSWVGSRSRLGLPDANGDRELTYANKRKLADDATVWSNEKKITVSAATARSPRATRLAMRQNDLRLRREKDQEPKAKRTMDEVFKETLRAARSSPRRSSTASAGERSSGALPPSNQRLPLNQSLPLTPGQSPGQSGADPGSPPSLPLLCRQRIWAPRSGCSLMEAVDL